MIGDDAESFGDEGFVRLPSRQEATLAAPRSRRLLAIAIVAAFLVVAAAVALSGTGYAFAPASGVGAVAAVSLPPDDASLAKAATKLKTQRKQIQSLLAKYSPHGTYIVVDQTQNRLYVKKDEEVVHTAKCSAGSGLILKEGAQGGRKWVFDTPRGLFRVQNRVAAPVWKKPDWAFVEEGKPIPKDPSERFEYGTLGEYALYLGRGYMIHGTLYERLLGRSVTHGCIRLGRDDLRVVWKAAPLGTSVYIY